MEQPAQVALSSLPPKGSVVGDYLLEDVLSEGGMGRVYRARHQRLGRQVALKMLLPTAASDKALSKRFFAEARAVNRIRHEHLIEVTDFADRDGGPAYYIMELLVGKSLRDLLESNRGRLPLKRSMHIWLQMADVLSALHEDCIVHRDLKPENVYLVARNGIQDYVKLLDFGAARLLDEEGTQIHPHDKGVVIGTPVYMAPEQSEGVDVDDLADIYAFGVMMYEMISGKHPHDASDVHELLMRKRSVTPTWLSELPGLPEPIPRELNELVMQCLAKKPVERPQSMQEVRLRLLMVETLQIQAKAEPTPPKPLTPEGSGALARRRRNRRRNVVFASAGAVLAAISIGLAIGHLSRATMTATEVQAPVSVSFTSWPDGAEVFNEGSELPFGRTPTVADLPNKGSPYVFVFKLAGYEDVIVTLDPATSTTADVTFIKKAKPPTVGARAEAQRRPKAPGRLKKGGFMDPFERRK